MKAGLIFPLVAAIGAALAIATDIEARVASHRGGGNIPPPLEGDRHRQVRPAVALAGDPGAQQGPRARFVLRRRATSSGGDAGSRRVVP